MTDNAARGTSESFPGNVELATRRLGEREWFVLRCTRSDGSTAANAPLTATGSDLVVSIVLVAADAAQRERIVRDLKSHIQSVVASESNGAHGPDEATASDELRLEHAPDRVTVGGRVVPLSIRELRLLSTLVSRRNRAVSRDYLLREIWPGPRDQPTRRVDVMVTRLREKLGTAGRFIQSVRGVGYRFAEVAPIPAASEVKEHPGMEPNGVAIESAPLKPQASPPVRLAS